MPTFQKVTGSTLSVSAALPATLDIAGFGALSYTDADPCEIISISGWDDSFDTEPDDTLCPDGGAPLKTKLNLGVFSTTLKYDKASAVHGILETAFRSASDVISVMLTHPNGTDKKYFTAQVIKYNPVLGGQSDFYTTDVEFQPHILHVSDTA